MLSDHDHQPTLPPEQQRIRDKCYHPAGTFIEFRKGEIEQPVPERFEKMVRMYPNRLAVKDKKIAFTYNELNNAANCIAQAILKQRGATSEPVALLMEQGAQVIAAILGVLKAGKFYVPLDPSFPMARTTYMLEDTQAPLIVTNTSHLSMALELTRARATVINVDDLGQSLAPEDPCLPIFPDAIAYVLYTSGSTGQPKGVTENHRNLLHEVMRLTNELHICNEDRITLLNSISFSGSARSIYGSLLNGAALFPYDFKAAGDANLANWLIQAGITIYRSGPTIFRQLVSTLASNHERFPKVRLITTAGEAVHSNDVELYRKHFSQHCIFVNGLRSTETGSVRHYFIDMQAQVSDTTVPVGYAIEDMDLLLLDHDGNEVGFDRAGEIAVKSRYLSPGYWRRPDLTQSVFLVAPDNADSRIYLTGDLGLMYPDGCLIHLGRKDMQVKVRGQRVEILEVEETLLALGLARQVAVEARAQDSGHQRLVAYIVPATQPVPTVSTLRRALAEKLPGYMVPASFVMLDSLPLTPTGKVDRRMLPDPGPGRPELDNPCLAPRTPVETKLAGIWTDVLGIDMVGIHDDFLDLGGHSLLATKLLSRVIETFQVEMPLRLLLEAPTIAEMAVVITQHQAEQADPDTVARLLTEVEAMAEENVQRHLADGRPSGL